MFLTDAEKDNLQHAVHAFSKHMLILRSISYDRGLMYFQITPKVHLMQHIPYQSRLINSRYTQVYAEESIVGHISRIYKASCNGPYRNSVQKATMVKYLVVLSFILDF